MTYAILSNTTKTPVAHSLTRLLALAADGGAAHEAARVLASEALERGESRGLIIVSRLIRQIGVTAPTTGWERVVELVLWEPGTYESAHAADADTWLKKPDSDWSPLK